ncbi:MAG TPA: proton-conducting transporter membrane subunit [Rectinemataceae bacterium]|nr:proton-conducting transporter membrane subunit [Rectinemataceae bacterium]
MTTLLVLPATVLAAVSGLPGMLLPRRGAVAQRIATVLMLAAAALGLAGALFALGGAEGFSLALPWPVVQGGAFEPPTVATLGEGLSVGIGLDPLSAFFLVPVFLIGGIGSVYGLGYWPQRRNPRSARGLQLFWGLLTAGMALLLISRHALSFLLGWEIMALSAFFLITTEHEREECRSAGWIYFIATHIGTLLLFAFFALWRLRTGSFALVAPGPGSLGAGTVGLLLVLALLAFGLKAGIMPLHFWLPGAHANGPSHVSALLSGVMLKMGVYGLMRVFGLLTDSPPVWGWLILLLGAASSLFGVLFAIAQHDLKRLLAYHSVENIGIIFLGLGIALVGRSEGRWELVLLGMGGALLHVWNHGLFKSLLFLGAGSVIHRSGSGRIDRLGALAKGMPWTAALFIAGAVAICGLPPLNGFVSEVLIYVGALHPLVDGSIGPTALAVVAPLLAMVGALAVACFVKVSGVVFLGEARTALRPRRPNAGEESPPTMIGPMLALGLLCLFIGLAPATLAPPLERAVQSWSSASIIPDATGTGPAAAPAARPMAALAPARAPRPGLLDLIPLRQIGYASAVLALLIGLSLAAGRFLSRRAPRVPTWDCGYAAPTARMQYSASSLAHTIVRMFSWILKPHDRGPRVEGAFPAASSLESHVGDATLDRVIVPFGELLARRFSWFRRFQQGLVQSYLLYVLVALLVLMGTLIPYRDIWAAVVGR